MRITVGEFRGVDRTCPVTFKDGGFRHERRINAVVGADGDFDRAATRARAAEVALGVQAKRAAGVFETPVEIPAED